MAYKFLNASLSIPSDPKTSLINDFQNALTEGFKNASTFQSIQEESPFGSGTLVNVDVRVNSAINSVTGEKLGDDFKLILFDNINHATGLGYMYYFDNNWWVTINTEAIKNLAATATVRRCNNILRWKADDGGVYSVPCAIDYRIKMNRNLSPSGAGVVMPSGYVPVFVQFNTKTNKIGPNQRFLFGNPSNWVAYKIVGGGLHNYNNLQTANNMSVGLLELDLETWEVNKDTDDLVNGIADASQFNYTVELNNTALEGQVGDTFQLAATVKMNGQIVTAPVAWSSTNVAKATVSSSGLVTFVAAGSCSIRCALQVNSNISATSSVTVSSDPVTDYNVVVTPVDNYILEGDTKTYVVNLYLNGEVQADAFVFTVADASVPTAKYVFTIIDGNSFSVKNVSMFLNAPLKINCVSVNGSKQISLTLKGGW